MEWKNVFEITKDDFVELVFPYLTNGPRDLISICNMSGKGEGKISESDIQQSISSLYAFKWQEIRKQFSSEWPAIDQFAQCIIEIAEKKKLSNVFGKKDFISAIKKEFESPDTALNKLRKVDWINSSQLDPPPTDERLFLIGILGYVYKGKKYYPWSGRRLSLYRLSDQIFFSPLFIKPI
jgi:hypothetical protein